MGCTPGLETPITPDEAGVLDAGDGVEGLGIEGWRRVVECVGLFGAFYCSHPAYYGTSCLLPWHVVASLIVGAWLPAA